MMDIADVVCARCEYLATDHEDGVVYYKCRNYQGPGSSPALLVIPVIAPEMYQCIRTDSFISSATARMIRRNYEKEQQASVAQRQSTRLSIRRDGGSIPSRRSRSYNQAMW